MRWYKHRAITPERMLLLLGLGIALSLLGDATLYIVLPVQYDQVGITIGQVGLALSANRAIRIVLNGPYGVLIERIPRRWMLLPSLFFGALAPLLYTLPGFEALLVGRLLWGTAWAGLAIGGTTVILDIATDENRGWLVGRYQMWFFIGIGISSLAGGLLFDAVGYNMTFYISTSLVLVAVVLWLLFLPETRPEQPKTALAETEWAPEKASALPVPEESSSLPLATIIFINGLNWLIFAGITAVLLPLLLAERIGTEIAVAGLIVIQLISFTGILSAFNTLISVVSSPLSGRFSDRSGNRWRLVLLTLALGIVSLGMAAVGNSTLVLLATVLHSLVFSVMMTQTTALVGDYTRQGWRGSPRQGRTLGVMNTAGDVGGTAGPLLAFALWPLIGLAGVYALCALLLMLILPWTMWIAWREQHPRPQITYRLSTP